ncbi:DUF4089 domain-containing protein [Komagataeibacter sp. FNDCR2]|uniref:DUF4089 domain-containing protein n=1 Tax=Komagataeibacter sp. FNDCR2 TaxID=2878682 RepID=UPI001E58F65D|nr:DUF4089 domain-containing protein [Komagataeibacter sp. FNDCR2]MCE2576485.1 DUF4089 domain-containing protein [Komagataeibacter sp. FNDCR2]
MSSAERVSPPAPGVTGAGGSEDRKVPPVADMARIIGLSIPEACMPDVVANTALLHGYADLLAGFALPDDCEPAYEYQP